MIDMGYIKQITFYEVKMLFRNNVFIILSVFTILGLPVCQYFVQGRFAFHYLIALPCALPLVNAFLFNMFQSLIVIFVVGNNISDEKHLDTLAALRVRRYGNGDYLIGKLGAVLIVISLLNLTGLLFLVGFHIFFEIPFSVKIYLFYWITLTFPALLFALGVSLGVYSFVRVSFGGLVLLMLLLLLDVLGLSSQMNGVLDYRATEIPNVFSQILGHVGLGRYLLQRSVILFIGLGCIAFAVAGIPRIDDSSRVVIYWKIIGIVTILLGCGLGFVYSGFFYLDRQKRQQYRESCCQYRNCGNVKILSHSIRCSQADGQLVLIDTLLLENVKDRVLGEMIFYLNPSLKVSRIEGEEENIRYEQEGIVVKVNESLESKKQKRLIFHYSGGIDERVCYLYKDDSVSEKTVWSNSLLRYGKHAVLLSNDYTFLIPECLWYPESCSPFHPGGELLKERTFTRFRLMVRHREEQNVISQGYRELDGDYACFTNDYPLAGISLCVGKYEREKIHVDGSDFEVYFFDREGVFFQTVEGSVEGLVAGIREIKRKLTEKYGCDYPFTKLALVEIPIALCTYLSDVGNGSGFVQPELLFIPESWCKSSSVTLLQKQLEDLQKHHSQWIDRTTIEATSIYALYAKNFQDEIDEFPSMGFVDCLLGKQWLLATGKNPLSLASMYTSNTGGLFSDKFPGIDVVVNRIERENFRKELSGTIGPSKTLKASRYLGEHSLRQAFEDPDTSDFLDELLKLKSRYFRQYISALIGRDAFEIFLLKWRQENRFEMVDFFQFAVEFQQYFNFDIVKMMQVLYDEPGVPSFLIQNVCQQLVKDSVFLIFDVHNTSTIEGVITCYTRVFEHGTDVREVGSVILRGGEYVRVAMPLEYVCDEAFIRTNLSANLPEDYVFSIKPEKVCVESPPRRLFLDSVFKEQKSDEIIVDDEDAGFQVIESKARSFFGNSLKRNELGTAADFVKGEFQGWLRSVCTYAYGGVVRGFYGKRVGNSTARIQWTATILDEGKYEVWVHQIGLHKWFQQTDSLIYYYSLEQGTMSVDIKVENGKKSLDRFVSLSGDDRYKDDFVYRMTNYYADWIPIGIYDLTKGPVCLSLHDKGIRGGLISADAVKWVKVQER